MSLPRPQNARTVRWASAGLVVFALALAVRMAWVVRLPEALTWEDEQEFAAVARHLAAGDGYVSESYRANPVLPALLGLIFRILGENYLVARALQSLIGAATCFVIYRLGTDLIDRSAGVLSGAWLALYPPHVYLSGVFYVEAVATFLLALSVYLATRAIEGRGRLWLALMTGAAVGLAALTRPVFLVGAPALLVAWLCARRIPTPRRVALGLALIAGVAVAVLPWTARNYRAYGRVIAVSSGFYTKLWQGNNELADGGPDDRDLMWNTPEWEARLGRLDPSRRGSVEARYAAIDAEYRERRRQLGDRFLASDEVLKPVILAEMRAHPGRTLALMARKTVTLFSSWSATLTQNRYTAEPFQLLAALSFYPLLVLAAAGAWMGLADRARLAPLYLVVAAVASAYVVLNTCTRFRLPLDPYLILFASLAATRLWRRVRGTGIDRVGRVPDGLRQNASRPGGDDGPP